MPLNTWTHIGVTFDAGAVVIYINGDVALEDTLSQTTINNPAKSVYQGNAEKFADGDSNQRGWVGHLGRLILFNRVLAANEMNGLARHNRGLDGDLCRMLDVLGPTGATGTSIGFPATLLIPDHSPYQLTCTNVAQMVIGPSIESKRRAR